MMMNLGDDQMMIILTILTMMMGSGYSRNPCASSGRINNWLMDHCEAKLSTYHLICSGGLHDKWDDGSDSVRVLTLCRWPEESLNPYEIFSKFPALRNLNVLDSNLTYLTKAFPNTAIYLENVTINGTNLEVLPDYAFSMLPSLRFLDLRYNALSVVDSSALAGPSLSYIYLFGNPWHCVSEMSWILNLNDDSVASRVVDRDKLYCKSPYQTRPLVPIVEMIMELAKQCQKTVCNCWLSYVGRQTGETSSQRKLMAFVSVNCTSRGLTEMPEFLPDNTTTLYLMKNKIRDLSPLKNPTYEKIADIYLDDNEIDSISLLEGSYWLDHFRALGLRGNHLTDLPSYVLGNALQQNSNANSIFLGNNPWRCDCHFTPGFQELLNGKHMFLFKDLQNITCEKIKNDENSGKQISDLSRTAICTLPDEHWIQPLDVLNVILAFLILFVLGKLLYDYWTFKRTGKLPWIVAKIP